MSSRAMCVLGSLALAAVLIGPMGCTNPQIGGRDMYVATTPQTYSEARAFYLGEPMLFTDCSGEKSTGLRQLMPAFDANEAVLGSVKQSLTKSGSAAGLEEVTREAVNRRRFVEHNQPVSVIVNKVITPPGMGTRDIAVVLDILTLRDEKVTPLVVWYQRDVPGGKELGFENLLVHYTAAWDSKIPPYFRLRLIDVEKEDNEVTRELLEGASKLAGSFAGALPHPIMPGVELGLEAAKQILGNQANKVLMDYTVQFYSAAERKAYGGADLGYLSTGHWIAVGLNRSQDAEFWRHPLYFDQRTLRVYRAEEAKSLLQSEQGAPAKPEPKASPEAPIDTGLQYRQSDRPRIDAPIILMTITTAESVVPTIVQDRSEELTKYLSDTPAKMNFDAMAASLGSLNSAMKVYIAKRRVEREQTGDAMAAMMLLLSRHVQAIASNASETDRVHKLSDGDVRLLMLTLEDQTLVRDKSTAADWVSWWNTKGQTGRFEQDATRERKIWKLPA